MPSETTLILFKPDCMEKNLGGIVLQRFMAADLSIQGIKLMQLTEALLDEHYAHIAEYPFFPKLKDFMQSKPVLALALQGDNAIQKVRDILGPTDSTTAPKGTIRGDFGESSMFNICHASDSLETATIELKRFFEPSELYGV